MVMSGVKCQLFAFGPVDVTANPSSLASLKSKMISLSGAGYSGCPGKEVINSSSSSHCHRCCCRIDMKLAGCCSWY